MNIQYLHKKLKRLYRVKRYLEKKLSELPKGVIVHKKISGHTYYYLVTYKDKKVVYKYLGKNVHISIVRKYKKAKNTRKKYRKQISLFNKYIRQLEKITGKTVKN